MNKFIFGLFTGVASVIATALIVDKITSSQYAVSPTFDSVGFGDNDEDAGPCEDNEEIAEA